MESFGEEEILQYCLKRYPELVLYDAWGERALFYNPENRYTRGKYFLTIKKKDGANDKASLISRKDVYRVNFGIGKTRFIERFGSLPSRPKAGGVIDLPIDFTELDILLPHPVYAWMGWVCVLCPTKKTFLSLETQLDECYHALVEKENNKSKK